MVTALHDTTQFLDFLRKFRDVERYTFAVGLDRRENDAEHAFQLAMFCWYLVEKNKLDLDVGKILRYALAHDLVEAYAGDTPFMHASETSKHERETAALERIKAEFGNQMPEMIATIEAYELQQDTEAKFVYAADKLIPILNAYMNGGRCWREFTPNIDLAAAIKIKRQKIQHDPVVNHLLDLVLEDLLADQERYFGTVKIPVST